MRDADDFEDQSDSGQNQPEYVKAAKTTHQLLAAGFEAVAQQIQVLLQIIQASAEAVRVYKTGWSDDAPTSGPVDGGVVASLDALILRATDRLYQLLQDEKAWDYKPAYVLYQLMAQAQKAQIKAFKEQADAYVVQKDAYDRAVKPSVLYRPKPIVLSPDKVIVYYGDKDAPEHWIAGIGSTLKEAMEDFDQQFATTSKWQFYYRYNQDVFNESDETFESPQVDPGPPEKTRKTTSRRKKSK